MMGDVGAVAELATAIFKWVTDADGYHDWSLEKKLGKLHAASLKALVDRDFAACDALIREYRRLSESII